MMALDEFWWGTVDDGKQTPYKVFSGNTFVGDWEDARGAYWGGYDYENPTQLTPPNQVRDANAGSSATWEAMLTLEREVLTDFAVQINATYRRYDNFNWSLKVFREGDVAEGAIIAEANKGWYEDQSLPVTTVAPYLPDDYTKWDGSLGEAPNNTYQTLVTEITMSNGETINPGYPSDFSYYKKRPSGRYNDYYGLDLIFNKRLSNKWMLNGSFTVHKQSYQYGDSWNNNTNLWALDGASSSAYQGGSSGKISQYTYTPWMFKIGGLYQLPFDWNVSFTFNARDGHILRERNRITDYTLPNTRNRTTWLYLEKFGHFKLDVFYKLDMRLEKVWRSGDFGRIYFMVDIFNVFNNTHENRRYQRDWGYFYYYGQGDSRNRWSEYTLAYTLNEILNPRVMRLGVRFQF
jgi:hypothetical protein